MRSPSKRPPHLRHPATLALGACLATMVTCASCVRLAEGVKDWQAEQRAGGASAELRPAGELPPNPHGRAKVVRGDRDRWLQVGGRPYLVLGVQPDAWAMENATPEAARQLDHAVRLRANTVQIPILWGKVEPEQDQYRLDYVRWALEQTRARDLNLILLWFGSNVVGKSGSPNDLPILPPYVEEHPETYPRLDAVPLGKPWKLLDPDRRYYNVLDPGNLAHNATLERERRAFRKVLELVSSQDREGRVILWQILNEVGAHGEHFGTYSEQRFRDDLVAYVRELARLQKQVHPIPSYMNFWEGLKGADPFAFLSGVPEIDLVGPDLYGKPGGIHLGDKDYNEFRATFLAAMKRYATGRNLLFVPETNTDGYYRSHLSAFYLAARPSAVGLSVWAVTHGSHRGFQPLVDPSSGALEQGGAALAEVYEALRRAMQPILRERADPRRLALVVSEGGGRSELSVAGRTLSVDADPEGAVIAFADGDGLGLVARRARVRVPRARAAERGTYDGESFRSLGPAPASAVGEDLELGFARADVVRVR